MRRSWLRVTYQFEYDDRIRCAFIGAGGHSYRNVYPALQYAPVDLRRGLRPQRDRAASTRAVRRAAAYTDHREMLGSEKPDAVFIVTGYDPDGRVQATAIADGLPARRRACLDGEADRRAGSPNPGR